MRERTLVRMYIGLQRLLPAEALGRFIHRLSRSRARWFKDLLIRGFVRLYGVDTAEAERPVPEGYESFNAFFTRDLRAGARPPDPDLRAVLSPADGTVQQAGTARGDALLQVKGVHYSLHDLLGGDEGSSRQFLDGAFLTVYLAPWNYHRLHMPLDGQLLRMTYVPGARWAVNAATAASVPGLFARNERVVCHFSGPSGLPFAVVLVGALNVASITTVWAGEVLPRRPREITRWDYAAGTPGTRLRRGEPLGQFNLGSTAIVVLPPGAGRWRPGLQPGDAVRVGEAVGHLG
jgi:phosphatidylserine decarboxylase